VGCVDCGGDNNWANCDALEIEKGTNRLPRTVATVKSVDLANEVFEEMRRCCDWIQQKANEVE
jgi:hypothetical protein